MHNLRNENYMFIVLDLKTNIAEDLKIYYSLQNIKKRKQLKTFSQNDILKFSTIFALLLPLK